MSFPVNINREPLEEFKEAMALQHTDCVYFYNPVSNIISIYGIYDNGYSFHCTKYENVDFMKHFNFIYTNKATKELTLEQFNAFVNQLNVLMEQSSLLKPLVTFDKYIITIKEILGMRTNKTLY